MNDYVFTQLAVFGAGLDMDIHFFGRVECDGLELSGNFIVFTVLISSRYSHRFGIFGQRELETKLITNLITQ
jgi:hypothetical protein